MSPTLLRTALSVTLFALGAMCAWAAARDRLDGVLVTSLTFAATLWILITTDRRTAARPYTPTYRVVDAVLIAEYEKLIRAIQDRTLPTDEQLGRFIGLLTHMYVYACARQGRAPIAALATSCKKVRT